MEDDIGHINIETSEEHDSTSKNTQFIWEIRCKYIEEITV